MVGIFGLTECVHPNPDLVVNQVRNAKQFRCAAHHRYFTDAGGLCLGHRVTAVGFEEANDLAKTNKQKYVELTTAIKAFDAKADKVNWKRPSQLKK